MRICNLCLQDNNREIHYSRNHMIEALKKKIAELRKRDPFIYR